MEMTMKAPFLNRCSFWRAP